MSNFRYIFYTVRTHPAETELFEDALTVLIPFIKSHTEYAYVIEKDNTPDRHLHTVVYGNYKDLNAYKNKLSRTKFKIFQDLINSGYIQSNHNAFNTQLVSKILDEAEVEQENVRTLLGYIYKEKNATRRESLFPEEIITLAIQQYWALERTKAKKVNKSDKKILTDKTAETYITQWCEENYENGFKDTLIMSEIMTGMIKDGHRFYTIPMKTLRRIYNEMCVEYKETDLDTQEQKGIEDFFDKYDLIEFQDKSWMDEDGKQHTVPGYALAQMAKESIAQKKYEIECK